MPPLVNRCLPLHMPSLSLSSHFLPRKLRCTSAILCSSIMQAKYNSNSTSSSSFTHLDSLGRANMVDTSGKAPTVRTAMAEAVVRFPTKVFVEVVDDAKDNKKGDIFSVSRIAGICAAKRTSELIPLCHQIALSHVAVRFSVDKEQSKLIIHSRVKTTNVTGVEVEALTACSVAALTVYDMCKALSHDITIGPIRLLGKSGGKTDFGRVEWKSADEENKGQWF